MEASNLGTASKRISFYCMLYTMAGPLLSRVTWALLKLGYLFWLPRHFIRIKML